MTLETVENLANKESIKDDNPIDIFSIGDITRRAQKMAYWTFDVDEAAKYLKTAFIPRKIDEILQSIITKKARELKVCEDDVRTLLSIQMGSKDKVNLRNWLNGKVNKIDRDSVIKIAYALQLTYDETESLLKRCWHDGFYLRSVKDLIYKHGLENKWKYQDATELADIFADLDVPNDNPTSSDEAILEQLTEHLETQRKNIGNSKEDLENVIRQNRDYFGTFHRKAYKWFDELYDEIMSNEQKNKERDYKYYKSREDDPIKYMRNKVSTQELCDLIVKGIPDIRRKGKNKALKTLVAEHVPTRTAMAEIRNRYKRNGKLTPVDRKLLILAYLSSEDGRVWEYPKGREFEAFIEQIAVINQDFLKPLGMASLDPRHPFDWIVMNSLRCAYHENDDFVHDWMCELVEKMSVEYEDGE